MFKKHNKSIVAFTLLLLAIIAIIFIFLKEDKKDLATKSIKNDNEISNLSKEDIELGAGYGLQLKKSNSEEDSQLNGQISMETPQDKLEIEFNNRGSTGQYILKVFYDYEEIKFKAGDEEEYNPSYTFQLESLKSINIPLNLTKDIKKDNKSHKITVGVYASPEKNAKTIKAMTNTFGVTIDYELVFNEGEGKISLIQKPSNPMKIMDVQFQGIMINNDFKSDNQAMFPPYSLKVKKGEKVKLAYRAGGYQDVEDYLILSMLDWNQINMDEKPYLLLKNEPTKLGYGTFHIIAPNKPGLYEFTSFIIPDPTKNKNENNFFMAETAYRFTIEVEE
ncbi:hypothetical protein ABEY41_22940 [Peribacillus butanolivorans]|uniref:hypothetical protein n=1 Tax=Peribacillus butanolivorans TaxID=421767 RepID=UPI003D2682D2